MKRFRQAGSIAALVPGDQRSVIFELTLLTFCPPGPLLRAAVIVNSDEGMVRRGWTNRSLISDVNGWGNPTAPSQPSFRMVRGKGGASEKQTRPAGQHRQVPAVRFASIEQPAGIPAAKRQNGLPRVRRNRRSRFTTGCSSDRGSMNACGTRAAFARRRRGAGDASRSPRWGRLERQLF